MKLSQFRRIIKEEVRRVLKEATKEDIVRKLSSTDKSILKVFGYTIADFKDFLGEVEAGDWDGITLNDFTLAKWVAIQLDAMFDDDKGGKDGGMRRISSHNVS